MADTTRPELLARVRAFLGRSVADRAAVGCPDLADWEAFFELYNGLLGRFAAKLGFSPLETDDLIQDAWADVVRLLPRLEYDPAKGGFRRWLYRIMRSKAADAARRRLRATEPLTISPHDMDQYTGPGADPVEQAHRHFLGLLTQVALDRYRASALPGEWAVVEACKLHDRDAATVAAELGITPEAARKRLQRGLAAIRTELAAVIGDLTE